MIKICKADGCDKIITKSNQSGLCRSHRMKAMHADPEFVKAHAERARKRMKAMHADPEFAKAHAERMKAQHADPEFAKANAERMKALHADPNIDLRQQHLRDMTDAQRADYDLLLSKHYTKAEALEYLGLATEASE